ncbi:thiamine phosphate synthase [Paracoccus sp. DMF-8]|uniref:thiamine phosphate synthase n=1 Tax=Paracoccus sp. DMF-8 TaxID=3019445 RepID=UPI0023E8C07C|nr:thiamine phosphate synthase [Paracoccus sp. DMF-8]MDF3606439.1 thiamine phosphate synthase [Paracoccus sp. DMF-8]
MTDQTNAPQLYLITPVGASASALGPMLAEVLDRLPVACLRIPGAGSEADLGRIADLAREIAHARDVAVVIEDHVQLALRHGLDGVHLTHNLRELRNIRKELGADAIIGAYAGQSRHDGLNAGEAGADYVCFGPCGQSALGHGDIADHELFAWWSEMIEVPVVAEGALTPALIADLAPVTDFIALGPEIWSAEDPLTVLTELWR